MPESYSGLLTLRKHTFIHAVIALCIAFGILCTTILAAQAVSKSTLYRQSAFATYVFSQDSTGFTDIVKAPQRIDVFVKFLGAVTSAYINFEMIPINEAQTFVAIFESLNDSVKIESFTYRGKSLTIAGTADGRREFFQFYRALEQKESFYSVSGHQYVTTDDKIRFELECALEENRVTFGFS